MKINATGEIKKDVENICISGEHNPEPSLLNNRKYREQGLLVHQAPWWTGLRSSRSASVLQFLRLPGLYRSVVMNQQYRLQTVGAHVEYNSVFQTLMSPASHPVILPPGIECKSSPHKWTSEAHPLLRMTVPQS